MNNHNINMANNELKVLGFWPSPFVHRVEWALMLKGVDYEYIEEDISNKSTRLLELNPVYKKVPVIVHDHKVISESLLILEYIDETWKEKSPHLMPQDPYERSMVRFWARFAEEKIGENTQTIILTQGDQQEIALKSVKEALGRIEEVLKGKSKFFGGDNLGYLDLVLGWISYLAPIIEHVWEMEILNQTQLPALTSWRNNFLNHSVIKEKLPQREELIVYFKGLRKKFDPSFAAAKKN